jgi:hypothetical protein
VVGERGGSRVGFKGSVDCYWNLDLLVIIFVCPQDWNWYVFEQHIPEIKIIGKAIVPIFTLIYQLVNEFYLIFPICSHYILISICSNCHLSSKAESRFTM